MRAFILFMLITSSLHASNYDFTSQKQEAQFHGLIQELRCLVCQNQSLMDSNAGVAKDLRNQVYEMIIHGQSDDEIIHYLTDRYGDFILLKPPLKSVTLFLWFGPLLFIGLGLIVYWRACSRKSS